MTKTNSKDDVRAECSAGAVSRRQMLAAGGAAGAGIVLADGEANPAFAQAARGARFNVKRPQFSKAERDRRWSAVRAIMARPGWNLDAIVTTSSDRGGDYARYLTMIANRPGTGSGPEVIFPRDATKAVYAQVGASRNQAVWAERLKDWIADKKLIVTSKDGAKELAQQMKAMGLDQAGMRIGLARLGGSRFESDGLVSSFNLETLRSALPGVDFVVIDKWGVDAGPVEESAMLKGPEEQDVVRRSAAAAERGLAAMIAQVRSGARVQGDIWWAAYSAMFMATGEDPIRCSISLDRPSNDTIGEPSNDPVKDGQIILQEIDANVGGYRAQVNHAVYIGRPRGPGYAYYKAGTELCIRLIEEAMRSIVPGKTTCGDLVKAYAASVAAAGAEDVSGVTLHSSGIYNLSRPRVGPSNSTGDLPIVLRPGMSFDFKPAIRLKRETMADVGQRNRICQVGEHILVTEKGAVRLGTRKLVPIATGA